MADLEQIRRHDAVIDRLLDSAARTALEVTGIIEQRVADLILNQAQPNEIQSVILDTWRNFSTTIANSMDAAAADTILLHEQMGLSEPGATAEDLAIAAQLKNTAYRELMVPAEAANTDILAALVVGAIVGTTPAQSAQAARIRISGYLATVTDPRVTQLQEAYRTAVRRGNYDSAQTLLDQIRTAWGTTPVGPNLLAQTRTQSHDSIMDFDSVYAQWRGQSLGVTVWRYSGGVGTTSRDFCADHAGKQFTTAEARELWSSSSWGGKRSGDPFVVRGGYNCRHYWTPVDKNIVGNLRRLQQ